MNLTDLALNLIHFRTETGNLKEIDDCLAFIEQYLKDCKATVEIHRYEDVSPVLFAYNTPTLDYDVLVLGHLDVVPAEDHMFNPVIKDGRIYGRGTLDMKSFAAVALQSLKYVADCALPIKFGVILSTDEEKGSLSTEAFLNAHKDLKAKIVLDNDVGGDIGKIILRCKNPVFVKLISKGEAAHGSTPWDGLDANERLFETWANIRKFYPSYSKDRSKPDNTWIDTVHFAKICGGSVSNIIADNAEALLDFRLIETSSVDDLKKTLDQCMAEGVEYQIVSSSTPVVMYEDDPDILAYKALAEKVIGHPVEFEYIGGATDSRAFALRGSTVIMHSGSGEGMHASGEYVDIASLEQVGKIQKCFLEMIAASKK